MDDIRVMLFRYKKDIFTDLPGIKHYYPQAVPVVLKLCSLAGMPAPSIG